MKQAFNVGGSSQTSELLSRFVASSFSITIQRGYWDCLRHDEIAARVEIIYFRYLEEKQATYTPDGLFSYG